jgi:D-3-phosphoglycerate dehydrogenase/C-terminal binding protein
MMRVLLSHYVHADPDFERQVAGDRAELVIQTREQARAAPSSPELRRSVDAIVHYPADTAPDGTPEDYPNVKVVLRSGVGYDCVNAAGFGARGVPVFNVPDYGTSEVADHAIALMLALTRGTATYHDAIRIDPAQGWKPLAAPAVRRLRGAVFGVVGLGRIGLAAANRARGFGMRVAFFDPIVPPGTEIAVDAQRCATLEELMGIADVLSLHAPASEETRGMIGAAAFAAAKPGLVVINTARGALVDLDALERAMRTGTVAAAGLDVLPREPADTAHPLLAAWRTREAWIEGRLTVSPHAAFYSPDALADMRRKSIEIVLAYLATGDRRHCVNADELRAAAGGG